MVAKNYDWKILQAVAGSSIPVGAIYLSSKLGIPSANIGRTLLRLEKKGMVVKVENKGRSITELGKSYIEKQSEKNNKLSVANELINAAGTDEKQSLLEVLQVRKLLESYGASCCAQSVKQEMIKELEDIQFDYIYELRHGRAGSEQDLKLHLKIAEFSGNRMIARILKLILADNNSYAQFTRAAADLHELRQKEHEKIIEAIRQRDGEKASQEMEAHLDRVIQNVKNSLPARRKEEVKKI